MMDKPSIFMGENPFLLLKNWLAEAAQSEISDPDAVALASVDSEGMPDIRIVLLRQVEPGDSPESGLIFFTNSQSQKGQQMNINAKAALVFHWKSLKRQIRVRGHIEGAGDAISDQYYQSRAYLSRIGAHASLQSQPLDSRETLMARVEELQKTYPETPPRPPHWGGYRLRPIQFEFWADGEYRLHDRFIWKRDNIETMQWTQQRYYP